MGTLTTARLTCDFCEEVSDVVGEHRLAVMLSGGWHSFWSGWDICPPCWDAGARLCSESWHFTPVRCLETQLKDTNSELGVAGK